MCAFVHLCKIKHVWYYILWYYNCIQLVQFSNLWTSRSWNPQCMMIYDMTYQLIIWATQNSAKAQKRINTWNEPTRWCPCSKRSSSCPSTWTNFIASPTHALSLVKWYACKSKRAKSSIMSLIFTILYLLAVPSSLPVIDLPTS